MRVSKDLGEQVNNNAVAPAAIFDSELIIRSITNIKTIAVTILLMSRRQQKTKRWELKIAVGVNERWHSETVIAFPIFVFDVFNPVSKTLFRPLSFELLNTTGSITAINFVLTLLVFGYAFIANIAVITSPIEIGGRQRSIYFVKPGAVGSIHI